MSLDLRNVKRFFTELDSSRLDRVSASDFDLLTEELAWEMDAHRESIIAALAISAEHVRCVRALTAAERERDEARAELNSVLDSKLEGYRALGERAANAEDESDRLRTSLTRLREERRGMVRVDVLLRAIRFFRRNSWVWREEGAPSDSMDMCRELFPSAHATARLEKSLTRRASRPTPKGETK
jgi:hypothetical protein